MGDNVIKNLKFKSYLVPLILSGEKSVTWRLFDDKNLQTDDELEFINSDTGEKFSRATIITVSEKKLGNITPEDFKGHESFESYEKMLETYKEYYGDDVGSETIVKIIKFELAKENRPKIFVHLYYKILKPVKKLYRFIFRPKTRGIKCILECNGEILLIKNTYGYKSWTFPGGGVKKNEMLEEALKREIKEEVGIKLNSTDFIGLFMANNQFKRDMVYCFTASVFDKYFKIDPIEILEARWFVISELPQLKPNANKVLELYKNYKQKNYGS